MTIRDWNAYRDGAWPWDFLAECFGASRIGVSDIDGVVERYGCFLFLEGKRPNAIIKTGQKLLLDALASRPRTTVLVLYGQPGLPEEMQVWPLPRFASDIDDVRAFVSTWFVWASAQREVFA